jgi:predicted MFS family arabinose efflux permease
MFAAIWTATLASSFGTVVQQMAAAWLMMSLSSSTTMVALVQTAASLPVLFLALISGTMADRFGRRPQMLAAQLFSCVTGILLTWCAFAGIVTPWLLLLFTLLLGIAQAMYLPAWQSSIGELVSRELVPAAMGVNAIGFNVARCTAPALGGIILAAYGPPTSFLFNAITFIGTSAVLLLWRPPPVQREARGEPMFAAIRAGMLYAYHHPPLRASLQRCLLFSFFASAVYAFLPVIARDMAGGGINAYAMSLTCFGLGAITAGMLTTAMRRRFSIHLLSVCGSAASGLVAVVISLHPPPILVLAALMVGGWGWVTSFTVYSTSAQLLSPEWMVGRAAALYQTAVYLGLAGGSAFWGVVSRHLGVASTLLMAGGILLALLFLLRNRVAMADSSVRASSARAYPLRPPVLDVRSSDGPIYTEVTYHVASEHTAEFLDAVRNLGVIRRRDGVRRWTLRRDLDAPERWIESFWVSSWGEQLVRAHRQTEESERARARAAEFAASDGRRIRRYLVLRDSDLPRN